MSKKHLKKVDQPQRKRSGAHLMAILVASQVMMGCSLLTTTKEMEIEVWEICPDFLYRSYSMDISHKPCQMKKPYQAIKYDHKLSREFRAIHHSDLSKILNKAKRQ